MEIYIIENVSTEMIGVPAAVMVREMQSLDIATTLAISVHLNMKAK